MPLDNNNTQSPINNQWSNMKITELYYYPLKSAKEIQATELRLEKKGISNDRIFAIIKKDNNEVIEIKTNNKLYFIESKVDGNNAEIIIPFEDGRKTVKLDLTSKFKDEDIHEVKFLGISSKGVSLNKELNKAVSDYFGFPCLFLLRLEGSVRCLKNYFRPELLKNSTEVETTESWNNVSTLHLTTNESLRCLNEALEKKKEKKVDQRTFRPNIVIEGGEGKPFIEKGYNKLKINNIVLTFVRPVIRCKNVLYDYEEKKIKKSFEPNETLREINGWPETPGEPNFGNNYLIDFMDDDRDYGTIKVGDKVEILEQL